MRRWTWPLLLTLVACRPPQPPTPPTFDLYLTARTSAGVGLPAVATVRSPTVNRSITLNANGDGTMQALAAATYHICTTMTGYVDTCEDRVVAGDTSVLLVMAPVPSPPVTWRTGEALLDVHGNFCNLADSQNRIIFTPALLTLWLQADAASWHDWVDRLKAAGTTHVFVSPAWNYPGSPIAGADVRANPAMFHGFLTALLREGFSPVVFLSDASHGQDEIDQYWPGLLEGVKDLWPYVILIPAWEPIPGTAWSPETLSYALETMHRLAPTAVLAYHGSPERATGVGKDDSEGPDPWQHNEAGFWTDHGGQYLSMLFYETEHGGYLLDPITQWNADADVYGACGSAPSGYPTNLDRWVNRWAEVLYRSGSGHCGWRQVRVVLAETVAFDVYHGHAVPAEATRVAADGLRVCQQFGVACTFGNGGPQ